MAMKPKIETTEIQILPISEGEVTFGVIGESPLIFNRMAEKAKRELLMPRGRRSAADRAGELKHSPVDEYQASVYRNLGADPTTRLKLPAPCFKGAMMTASLDLPGTRRTEIGRLVWLVGTHIDLFGIPQLMMSVVRSADIQRTPDIRTRAIVPQWACQITVRFVMPKLTAVAIGNLVGASGILAGVGDFRQERGKGNFGQFRICDLADEDYLRIIETGGREAQDEALNHYRCYDDDSEDLLTWFLAEQQRREAGKTVRLRSVREVA